jgi:hypothetical protein
VRFRKIFKGLKESFCSAQSFFSEDCCLVAEPTSTPNESLETGVMYSFSEDSRGVGGVKGVRMLREAVLDLPEGVSGASQMSLKPTGGDTVETVDVGDNHEKFLELSGDGGLAPSPLEMDADRIVLPEVR